VEDEEEEGLMGLVGRVGRLGDFGRVGEGLLGRMMVVGVGGLSLKDGDLIGFSLTYGISASFEADLVKFFGLGMISTSGTSGCPSLVLIIYNSTGFGFVNVIGTGHYIPLGSSLPSRYLPLLIK
jgi:hypothetical protein